MALHDGDTEDNRQLNQKQFWDLYLHEHRRPLNCWLHVIGTVSSWLVLVAAFTFGLWWLLILVPVVGYGLAWLGHLLVEGNKPTSIRFPLRSLWADYKLTWLMLTGQNRLAKTTFGAPCPSSDTNSGPAELKTS